MLQQVLFNLIVNASQATDDGGEISVSSRCVGKEVIIEVADNGCGIPQSELDKVFEPFFTTKPVGVGTGLGLSMVRNIVDKFSGRIIVESENQKGTKISLHFELQDPLSKESTSI